MKPMVIRGNKQEYLKTRKERGNMKSEPIIVIENCKNCAEYKPETEYDEDIEDEVIKYRCYAIVEKSLKNMKNSDKYKGSMYIEPEPNFHCNYWKRGKIAQQ